MSEPSAPIPATELERIPRLVERLQRGFASGRTRPLAWRTEQLTRLAALARENRDALIGALQRDFGKPAIEALLTDVAIVAAEADLARKAARTLDEARARGDAREPAAGPRAPRARAARHGADHRALELSGAAPALAPRRRPRGGELRGAEALGAHAPHLGGARGSRAALSRSRVRGPRRRRRARRPARCLDERFDHIFYTGGAAVAPGGDGGGREAPDAGDPRARRQEPLHRRRDRRTSTSPRAGSRGASS